MLIPLEAEVESLHDPAAAFCGLNHLHYVTNRTGFRIQESGVRMKGICFSPTAFCFLPSAFCLLPTAYCIQDSGFRK